LVDVPLPKSSYDNVKMVVYFDIINLMGNYIVVNELKSPYENKPFKRKINVHVLKKKLKSTQK
jgi:hypothetical protein